MIKPVKLSVDTEAQRVVQSITDGLSSRFDQTPAWLPQLLTDIAKTVVEVQKNAPAWFPGLSGKLDSVDSTVAAVFAVANTIRTGLQTVGDMVSDRIPSDLPGALAKMGKRCETIGSHVRTLQSKVDALQEKLEAQSELLRAQQLLLLRMSQPWWKRSTSTEGK